MSSLKTHIQNYANEKEKAIYNAILDLIKTGKLRLEETPLNHQLNESDNNYILNLSEYFRITIPELDQAKKVLNELTTEEFYWRYKPWTDDEGKQRPGLIKNITMIQEYIKEELSKLK